MRDRDLTTFASSDHGFAPQFLAIDASKVLVDLGLLSAPQTSNCRPATGETIGKAKACFAGGALQIYLNQAGPRPGRRRASSRCAAADAAGDARRDRGGVRRARGPQRLGRRRLARGLGRDRPRVHEGGGAADPERRRRHGRHVAPDADRRPRGLREPAVPVRRGHAGHAVRALGVLRAARLRARHAGPVDEHEHAGDVPRGRAGDRAPHRAQRPQHRRRADGRVPARGPRAGTGPGRRAARHPQGAGEVHAGADHRAERLPRAARADHDHDRRAAPSPSAARRSSRRCSTRRPTRCPGDTLLLVGRGQRRRVAAELGAAARTGRRSTS